MARLLAAALAVAIRVRSIAARRFPRAEMQQIFFLSTAVLILMALSMPSSPAAEDGSTGLSWQIESSQIRLDRVYSDWSSDYDVISNSQGPAYFNDCVTYRNRSNRPISDVQVMFALVDENDHPKFAPLFLNVRRTVAPDGSVAGTNCRDHAFGNGIAGRWLVGWVNSVSYADGTTWHAAPPVVGRVIHTPTVPVEIRSAMIYLPLQECADIANVSQRNVRHVQIVFRHVAADGAVLGEDALDVRSVMTPGSMLNQNCRVFSGRSDPDVFYYGYAASHGELDVQPPEIEYANRPSRLSVYVREVDFEDGTSLNCNYGNVVRVQAGMLPPPNAKLRPRASVRSPILIQESAEPMSALKRQAEIPHRLTWRTLPLPRPVGEKPSTYQR